MGIGDGPRPRHGSTGPWRAYPRRRCGRAEDTGPSARTTWPTRDPPATRAGRARRRTRCRGSRPGSAPFGARPARLPQPGYPSMRNSRSAFHHRRHSPFSQGVCKRGIRTHDRRFRRPLLYPPELACWLVSARRRQAVHAAPNPSVELRASRDSEPEPLPRHRRCRPVDDRPRLRARDRSNPCSDCRSPKRRGPGGQCRPGPLWRSCREGTAASSRPSGTKGLARHTAMDAREIASGRARAFLRCIHARRPQSRHGIGGKVCHRGAHFTRRKS
jgi:hypothetical protein